MHKRIRNALPAILTAVLMLVVGGAVLTRATPANAGSCDGPRNESHTDYTGTTFNQVWYCGNYGGSWMYVNPDFLESPVSGYMDSTWSWFACYKRGREHAGGNNVYYYSQGDRSAPGQEWRHAWGYIPAVNVYTDVDPWPGMPECGSATSPVMRIAAGKENCPRGYVCAWSLSYFQGWGVAWFGRSDSWGPTGMNDNSWSFFNNGYSGSLDDVRFFRDGQYGGGNFVLCNGEAIPYLPPNAAAKNGWRDAVSSHRWENTC
jgi:hypothetical protein